MNECNDVVILYPVLKQAIIDEDNDRITINWDELKFNLHNNSFITWELLKNVLSTKLQSEQVRDECESVCVQVLTDLAQNSDTFNNFYSLLSSCSEIPDQKFNLNAILCKHNLEHDEFVINLYLALLGSKRFRLIEELDKILSKYYTESVNVLNFESIALNGIQRHEHFVDKFIKSRADESLSFDRSEFYNKLLFCKIIYILNNECTYSIDIRNVRSQVKSLLRKINPDLLDEPLKSYYHEITRQMYVLTNIILKSANVYNTQTILTELLTESNIIELLIKLDFNILENRNVLDYITRHFEYKTKASGEQINSELEIYNEFIIIAKYIEIIQLDDATEDYLTVVTAKIDVIKKKFRLIDSFANFIKLLENCFVLIFMRTDYNRFICSKIVVLEKMLTSLDFIITQNKHFEKFRTCDASLNDRFNRIIGYISDGLWRLSIFANKTTSNLSLASSETTSIVIKNNNIKYILCPYKIAERVDNSSDEEEAQDDNKITKYRRVKPRKRRSLHRSGSDKINNPNNNTTSSNAEVVMVGESDLTEYCCQDPHHDDNSSNSSNNIIMKMLSSVETLAVICMNRGDFTTVRQIISKFKMESTMLSNEIYLTDHFVQTKVKLAEIFKKYDKQDLSNSIIQTSCSSVARNIRQQSIMLNNNSPPGQSSMIQIIKNAAAIGLEVTKITNIIENFINLHRITQQSEVIDLLAKHRNNYSFLRYYIGDRIQISYILDIMLSLSTSYDICLILYNLINKYYNLNDCDNDSGDHKIGRFDNVGYYPFVKRVLENLSVYKKYRPNDNVTVEILLLNEVYSFDLVTLENQLEIERFINANNDHTNSNVETLNSNVCSLLSKVNNFYRTALQLLRLMDEEADLNLDTVLTIDFNRKIGDLIFAQKFKVEKIEEIVSLMNFNLIYVIAINCIDRIEINLQEDIDFGKLSNRLHASDFCTDDESPNDSLYELNDREIINYISSKNILIAFLLANIFGMDSGPEIIVKNSHLFSNFAKLKTTRTLSRLYRGENIYLTVLNWNSISFNRNVTKFLLDRTIELPVKLKVLQNSKKFRELNNLIDIIVAKLIESDPCANFPLIEKITNLNNKCEILIKNIYQIENINLINNYVNLIRYDRHLIELDHNLKSQLNQFSIQINIYNKISGKLNMNWKMVAELSDNQPETIIEKLLMKNCFELLLEWCTIHMLTNYALKFKKIIGLFTVKLFEYNCNTDYDLQNVNNLLRIIEQLPADIILKFYKKNLLKIKNIYIIKYLLEYLKVNDRYYNDQDYSNIIISLHIFEILLNLSYDNINNLFLLFNSPLLIIEQFIMNSKFDLLQKVICAVRKLISPNAKCKICCSNSNNFGYDIIQYYRKNMTGGGMIDGLHDNVDYIHANIISNECIDLLLRIYATKSLDFRIITNNNSSLTDLLSNSLSQSLLSIDSIPIEKFTMPKTPPSKENWINDRDTSLCMCCKRSIFTLLTRRHHCRRCGRVVCHSCSISRMKIPNMYDNIFVRFCDDCFRQTEATNVPMNEYQDNSFKDDNTDEDNGKSNKFQLWELYGNLKHDNIVRDEFGYEFAPSVPLCLSILSNHVKSNEYSQFLLHHCRKFESLLRPIHNGYTNPEIDYIFVTRLLHCLALAAKVYGSESSIECGEMIDHVEVLLTIVQNDCQYLLPMEPLNSVSIRKLCDNLVLAEKWNLALELSLKCGLTNTGVMAAWGISCLRSGCYETAREKFTHCMVRITVDENNTKIINILDTEPVASICKLLDNLEEHVTIVKRPQKSPPLLYEIIKIMEQNYRSLNFMSDNTLERAKSTINSNASLKSQQHNNKRDYNIPSYEPAINILNTLETLKQTAQGNYVSSTKTSKNKPAAEIGTKSITLSRYYEEAMYYLTTYGSHTDIIKFLIKHKQFNSALTYILIQKCDPEIFIVTIFMSHLKSGQMPRIIKQMIEYSDTLVIWRDYIIKTCRYLESKGMLNSLYQLQILLNDPVRASMTCVKFFSMNCQTFKELQNNLHHLYNAQQHLQTELELCQWVEIKTNSGGGPMNTSTSTISSANGSKSGNEVTFIMKFDSKTLNNHITTILRQIEITKFLYGCENGGINIIKVLSTIFMDYNCAMAEIPTLFNSVQGKIQLCVLVLVCGKNIEEGFGLAYRLIQDFNLNSHKIYAITARYLASNNRIQEVEKLIDCMKSNNGTDTLNCDEIIALSIQIAVDTYGVQIKSAFENLMKLIVDKAVKINCHIVCGQLKTAYLLAVQTNRLNDIKKIRKQAEQTNQSYIVKLCEKKLNSVKM